MKLTFEEKLKLITEVGEEIIGEEELIELLKNNKPIIAYDGFEPSGRMHIAQGLMKAINVNKLTKAGVQFKFWVADWFALMNNKLDGDLNKIQTIGKYFVEVWKACGMDMVNTEFLWTSKNLNQEYWLMVLKIARLNTLARVKRCSQIMGRSESDELSAAQIIYPCMQAADIWYLKADIAQLGMDQRKVNMLARETFPKLGLKKPIAIHHHMLMGLTEPKETDLEGIEAIISKKMSKSNPNSSIFMTDTVEEVNKKFKKAYCPEGVVKDNPVLEYCKYIIFEKIKDNTLKEFKIERDDKFGGDVVYNTYNDLEKDFVDRNLHPMDLKKATAKYINELLDPVRIHFSTDSYAKELLKEVNSYFS